MISRVRPDRIAKGMWWDQAWSLIGGCSPCSPGCDRCWAAAETYMRGHQNAPDMKKRYARLAIKRDGNPQFRGNIRINRQDFKKPLRIQKPTVWAIWNDLFWGSVRWKFIDQAFETIDMTPEHFYMILTKRPANMLAWYNSRKPTMNNVAFGTTVCNASELNNLVWLMKMGWHSNVQLFLSIEPMLGPMDIRAGALELAGFPGVYSVPTKMDGGVPCGWTDPGGNFIGLDLVICGGESGSGARPMNVKWVRDIRDQCRAAHGDTGVSFFFKQWGEWLPFDFRCAEHAVRSRESHNFVDGGISVRVGKKAAGRTLDGIIHNASDAC